MSSCYKNDSLCCSSKKIEKDVFERCYTFTSTVANQIFILWQADGIINPCGTLTLSIKSIEPLGASLVDVFMNDTVSPAVQQLQEGDSIIVTLSPLNLIAIIIFQPNVTIKLNLCLTINYECC